MSDEVTGHAGGLGVWLGRGERQDENVWSENYLDKKTNEYYGVCDYKLPTGLVCACLRRVRYNPVSATTAGLVTLGAHLETLARCRSARQHVLQCAEALECDRSDGTGRGRRIVRIVLLVSWYKI